MFFCCGSTLALAQKQGRRRWGGAGDRAGAGLAQVKDWPAGQTPRQGKTGAGWAAWQVIPQWHQQKHGGWSLPRDGNVPVSEPDSRRAAYGRWLRLLSSPFDGPVAGCRFLIRKGPGRLCFPRRFHPHGSH